MAEMKFNCPSCNQLIAADELWIGQEIQCPMCAKPLTVPNQQEAPQPHNPLVPKPPGGGGARLSIGQARHAPAAVAPQAVKSQAVATAAKKSGGSGRVKTFAIWGIVLAALGAGIYFGWPYLKKYQDKLSSSKPEPMDGGEAGHIANLNNVLDATDPSRPGGPRLPSSTGRTARQTTGAGNFPAAGQAAGMAQPAAAGGTNLPVIPSSYTLDLAAAKIPEGKVNGTISGTPFVADVVRVDPSGAAYVFQAIQGTLLAPEAGVRIFLHLKPGETLTNHTWKITSDTTGGPTVTKLWKIDPKHAATTKNFSSGYSLNLELGDLNAGQISGKIYLALPDAEQSFLAGVFTAQTTYGSAQATAVAAPVARPAQAQDPAAAAAFQKRYGLTPGAPR
jgi:hypothetical protein